MGFLDRLRSSGSQQPPPPPVPPTAPATWLQVPTPAWGSLCSVVGESYYMDSLTAVLRQHPGRLVTAQLVPEPENRHDREAIRVQVGGVTVGYIASDMTDVFHGLIRELHGAGLPATCRARLTGGTSDRSNIGITISVANPLCRFAPGTPFLGSSDLSTVTLSKKTLDADAVAAALGSLHSMDLVVQLGDGGDGLIGAYMNGQLFGRMTVAMSERYLPVLQEVHAAGIPLTCYAHLRHGDNGPEAKVMLDRVD